LAVGLIRYLVALSFAHRGILSGFYILSIPRRLNVGADPFFLDSPSFIRDVGVVCGKFSFHFQSLA
jgi:hypothetical protein